MLSFAISCRGFPLLFFAGAFFCFFELGGVLESREASCVESMSEGGSSSSLSGFGRFFEAGLVTVFKVLWTSFLGAAFVALGAPAAFFGAALALAFYGRVVSLSEIEVVIPKVSDPMNHRIGGTRLTMGTGSKSSESL